MTDALRRAAVGLLGLLLALGFGLANHLWLGLAALALALAWVAAGWRTRAAGATVDNLGLVLFVGGAGWGLLQGLSAWLALAVLLLALAAWDLGHFARRQALALDEAAAARMERIHLVRLGQALGAGLVLGALALVVRVALDLALALVVGLAALVALSRLVVNINRS